MYSKFGSCPPSWRQRRRNFKTKRRSSKGQRVIKLISMAQMECQLNSFCVVALIARKEGEARVSGRCLAGILSKHSDGKFSPHEGAANQKAAARRHVFSPISSHLHRNQT